MRRTRTRRAGFGSLYLMVIAGVVLMTGTGLVGMVLSQQSVGTHGRLDGAAELRAVGESYLQLATAAVHRWANEPGGPTRDGRELHELFRTTLLEDGGGEVALELEARELLPDSPWIDGSRYRLVDGVIGLVLEESVRFSGVRHNARGRFELSFQVEDTRGEIPTRQFQVRHQYLVMVPSIPRPFDGHMLVIRDPSRLIEAHDASVQRFLDRRDELHRVFRDIRDTLPEPGAGPAIPAIAEIRAHYEAEHPLHLTDYPVPARGALHGGVVMVADPEDGAIPLEALSIQGRLDEIQGRVAEALAELADAEAELAAQAAALEEASAGLLPPDPALVEAARVAFVARIDKARAAWNENTEGLRALAELQEKVSLYGGAVKERMARHQQELRVHTWRDRAHYRIQATSGDDALEQLQELGRQVSPLNGVVHVSLPEGEVLPLVRQDHGLSGRFLLAVRGAVELEDFRPAEDEAPTRAVVLATGRIALRGQVEAAVIAEGAVEFEPDAVLTGALLAHSIEDDLLLRGELRPLGEAGQPHRFTIGVGDTVRQDVHFVAIDPVPVSRRHWALD